MRPVVVCLLLLTLGACPAVAGARYLGSDDAYGTPAISSHIWELELPSGLKPGVHTVEVRAIDEFGQERRGQSAFEVTTVRSR